MLVLVALSVPSLCHADDPPVPQPQVGTELSMNFSEVPLDTVLDYLSESAGIIIIKEVEVEGRVSVVSKKPVTAAEAINLLNTLLHQRGFATIRNGRTLTVVTTEEAKKRNIPVRSGADPDAIEPTDEMVTHVIPIRYADAQQLRDDLAPLLPTYAQVAANVSSNALILTDTAAGVRRIVEIIRELDRHIASVADVRVFTLQYAEAASTARLINEIFDVEGGAQPTQPPGGPGAFRAMFFRGRGGRGGGRGGGDQAAPEGEGGLSQKITAAADERTNTVVVRGPADVLDVVADVIQQLDSDPAEQQSVFIYRLKNADATKLAATLTQLFEEVEDTAVRPGGGRNNAAGPGGRARANPPAAGAADAQVATDLAGEVSVVADADTNALVVMTSTKNFDRVKEIIAQLDQAVPQVLIKVLIAEVTHDNDIDLGIEFSAMNVRDSGSGWTAGTDFGLAAATEGFNFAIIEADLTAAVHALAEVGKLEVLSRPYVLASDNQTARITVGEEVPFIRDTRITETGQTINTIVYEDIGIILEVTPHVNPDGLVIMTVAPEISVESDDTVEITDGVNAAKFRKRSAESRVAIRDGQTIVIGGLVQDRTITLVSKVPLLGDLPLLGGLFRRTRDSKSKTELLIFITPHVARQQEELQAVSDVEKDGNPMMRDAVAPGRFDKHLDQMGQASGAQSKPKGTATRPVR